MACRSALVLLLAAAAPALGAAFASAPERGPNQPRPRLPSLPEIQSDIYRVRGEVQDAMAEMKKQFDHSLEVLDEEDKKQFQKDVLESAEDKRKHKIKEHVKHDVESERMGRLAKAKVGMHKAHDDAITASKSSSKSEKEQKYLSAKAAYHADEEADAKAEHDKKEAYTNDHNRIRAEKVRIRDEKLLKRKHAKDLERQKLAEQEALRAQQEAELFAGHQG